MNKRIELLLSNYPQLESCVPEILAAYDVLREAYAAGNKLLLCGNGGSASDADHISGELLKGFQSKRPLTSAQRDAFGDEISDHLQQSLPAIPLTAFNALSTAYTNDVSAEYIYAQLTLGLGNPGDVILGISTSGNAVNVGHALKVAKGKGMKTLGLSGESGGAMKALCDICICVPSTETFRIQEYHLPIYHVLCLMVEDHFFVKEEV
ncbi:SIS domain-containing protein [Kiritimatiellaeota bacterium B1221]|nr:SIS domain-containing protein [Kiritimatiellaeota bacterium B1221]